MYKKIVIQAIFSLFLIGAAIFSFYFWALKVIIFIDKYRALILLRLRKIYFCSKNMPINIINIIVLLLVHLLF